MRQLFTNILILIASVTLIQCSSIKRVSSVAPKDVAENVVSIPAPKTQIEPENIDTNKPIITDSTQTSELIEDSKLTGDSLNNFLTSDS
ncbi:MAG: hypothetical protein GXZ03_04665, partial [Proteiniphilum sp.]|nr:hypothetical protein [Proteiniphilum sp.]